LWFDDDPLAGPPDNLDYVADINMGRAYTETYRRLIKNPDKQILMGVQFYMDAAVTGQFANLPVTAVRCALSQFSTAEPENRITFGGRLVMCPTTARKYPMEIECLQNRGM
jgi:hypothetical protein